MSLFDDFLDALRSALGELAERHWRDYRDEVLQDGRAFAESVRRDLERWLGLVQQGALTPDEFAWLVRGQADVAELKALERAGLTRARLDRFRTELIDTVVGAALRVI